MPKGAKLWALVAVTTVAVLSAVLAFSGVLSDDENPRAVVSIEPSTLAPGERFTVRFAAADPADRDSLRRDVTVELHEGDEDGAILHCLNSVGGPPVVDGACRLEVGVDARGEGRQRFVLPETLRQGRYALCGDVGFGEPSTDEATSEGFCREIEVVSG